MKLFKICYCVGMIRFGMSFTAHDRELMESIKQMLERDEAREEAKRYREIIAQERRQNAMILDDIRNRIDRFLDENEN